MSWWETLRLVTWQKKAGDLCNQDWAGCSIMNRSSRILTVAHINSFTTPCKKDNVYNGTVFLPGSSFQSIQLMASFDLQQRSERSAHTKAPHCFIALILILFEVHHQDLHAASDHFVKAKKRYQTWHCILAWGRRVIAILFCAVTPPQQAHLQTKAKF